MSPLSTSLLALGEEPKRRFKPRLRTRFRQDADVASYSELPPIFQKPTAIGWFFFVRSPSVGAAPRACFLSATLAPVAD